MPFDLWISFFVAAAILVVAPGPDNIFVTLQSAIYGPRAGIFVTLGLCVGVCFHTCLVSLGVATVVATSPVLLFIIQCLGASYLLYLAWGAWHAPVNKKETGEKASEQLSSFQYWRRGVLMNITNPKVLIFFWLFSPQFIREGTSDFDVMIQMLIMGLTFMGLTLIIFSVLAWCAGSLAERLLSPRMQYILNKASACIFTLLVFTVLLAKVN